MPKQAVDPRARLASRVGVLAAKKIGLGYEVLEVKVPFGDAPSHLSVWGVESARVGHHAREVGARGGRCRDPFAVDDVQRHRDFDQHMFAGAQAGHRLLGVKMAGCGKDDCIDVRVGKALVQIHAEVRNGPFLRERRRGSGDTSHKARHVHSRYSLEDLHVRPRDRSFARKTQMKRYRAILQFIARPAVSEALG